MAGNNVFHFNPPFAFVYFHYVFFCLQTPLYGFVILLPKLRCGKKNALPGQSDIGSQKIIGKDGRASFV
jgi:hypothetical protein